MASEDDISEVLAVPEMTVGARRILEVASDLFYRHGIHAVGVDTIAAESGFTKRTLYDRFGSKDNLVATYLKARHQRWWQRMEQRLADQPASPVLAVFDSYVQDSESSDRGCAFINAAAELPADHQGHQVIRAHKQAVRQRLARLILEESSAVENTAAVADEVFLLLEGAIAHRGIDGNDQLLVSARAIAAQIVRRHAPGAAFRASSS